MLTRSQPSRKELDCYEVVVVLTNIDGLIYASRRFILPSRVPQYSLASYGCVWDEVNLAFKVHLRRSWEKIEKPFVPTVLIDAASKSHGHTSTTYNLGLTSNNSTPSLSTSNADQSVLARIEDTLASLAQPCDAESAASESHSSTPAREDRETAELATPAVVQANNMCKGLVDACLESPIKAQELTPSIASGITLGLHYELDDSLLESPVKAHLIVRPGAPTPGRGRTQYQFDSDEEEGNHTRIIADSSSGDDVFGPGEIRMSWYDSSEVLPRLDASIVDPSVAVDALDLAAEHQTVSGLVHSHLEWLSLDSREELFGDIEDIINSYQQMSLSGTRSYLQEAVEKLAEVSIPTIYAPQQTALDLDLDAFFDGQGATDLEGNASEGNHQEFQHRASISCVPDQTMSITFDHYNWFGDRIQFRSSTPASVSLLVQLAAERKKPFAEMCRQGVLLAQANKYIDAIAYRGPFDIDELQGFRGVALQNKVTGYAVKVTDPAGHFCDPRDGDAVLKDFDSIWNRCLIPKTQPAMQRPYLVSDLDQDHGQSRGWVTAPPVVSQSFRQRKSTCKRNSKLCIAHSMDEELGQHSDTPGRIEELSDSSRGSSVSTEGEVADSESPVESDESPVEEYSPLDPVIPGQQRVYVADPQPEMDISEEEMQRQVNALLGLDVALERIVEDDQLRHLDHASISTWENDSADSRNRHSSGNTTPPSPDSAKHVEQVLENISSAVSKIFAIHDSTSAPKTTEAESMEKALATSPPPPSVNFNAVYDSSPSFPQVPILPATIPAKPTQQLRQPDPPAETTTPSTCTDDEPEEDQEGLSRYAFAYGCVMFGLGIGIATFSMC